MVRMMRREIGLNTAADRGSWYVVDKLGRIMRRVGNTV